MSEGGGSKQTYDITAAEAITQCLLREGIDTVFGIPGGYLSMLLDAFCRAGIRSVEARHEAAAAYMAAGWAQATGKIGVVYAQSGPGVTNALTGFAAAHMDSTPMLLIASQTKRDDFGGLGHQESTGYDLGVDQLRLYQTFCTYAVRPPTPATIPRMMRTALSSALRTRGCSMLDLPVDLLSAKVTFEDLAPHHYRSASMGFDPKDVAVIADLVRRAQQPALLIGNRASHIGAGPALVGLCEEQQLACATVSHAKGVMPEDHPLSLGALGRSGQRAAAEYFKGADLIVSFGARLGNLTTLHNAAMFPNLVQIDIDEREIGRTMSVKYGAIAELRAMAEALRHALADHRPERRVAAQVAELRKRHEVYATEVSRRDSDPITPPRALQVIRENLPHDALIVGDTGTTCLSLGRHLPVYAQDGYYGLYGLASMGSGMPMSLGVALAKPDALVMSVVGDGAFLAHASEVGVAVQHGIRGIHIVLNNNQYRSVLERQHTWFDRIYVTRILNPDYAGMARAFGCDGYSVKTSTELADAVKRAVTATRPVIIEVKVDESFTETFYPELAEFDKTLFAKPVAAWPLPRLPTRQGP